MRRAQYQEKKDEINEQKREAYRARKALEEEGTKTIALRAVRGDVTAEYKKSARPGSGKITFDDGYEESKHREEIEMAQWLHDNLGGDITVLAESKDTGVKMPDYVWQEKFWELKTVSSVNAADQAFRKAVKQIADNPGGVIVDFGNNDVDMDAVQKELARRFNRCQLDTVDVMVLRNDTLERVRRYKK
jgi:hypothetical protein